MEPIPMNATLRFFRLLPAVAVLLASAARAAAAESEFIRANVPAPILGIYCAR